MRNRSRTELPPGLLTTMPGSRFRITPDVRDHAEREAEVGVRLKQEKALRKQGRTLDGLLQSGVKKPKRTGPFGRKSNALPLSGGGANGTGKKR